MKIAIIGTGISGLSAAYLLNPGHDITVYEAASRLGGHSRTVTVWHGDRIIPVDTGFIVFNERNYPNLTALFARLAVETKPSDMTFALTVRNGWLEWGAKDLNAIFGQRRNLVRPRFWKMFGEAMTFNNGVLAALKAHPHATLGELLDALGLGEGFKRYYLLPMAGAIWSSPPTEILKFPARVFVQFFDNHGLLSMSGQPQWRTVSGGSRQYVEKLAAPFRHRVRLGCGAVRIERGPQGVKVTDTQGYTQRYDQVVLACHSDEALGLLGDRSDAEHTALSAIRYRPNTAILHRDPRFMPRRRRCWASWVYHSDDAGEEPAISVTYWMNRLQSIDESYPLFVTLNPHQELSDQDVFDRHVFHHPVFDQAAIAAQAQLAAMRGHRNTWFCGAYMRHGFHEDGLASAISVCEGLGARIPWRSDSCAAIETGPAVLHSQNETARTLDTAMGD